MKDLETLLNVRENISLNLLDGVKNRKSDFRTFTLCTTGIISSGRTVVLRGYDSINNMRCRDLHEISTHHFYT